MRFFVNACANSRVRRPKTGTFVHNVHNDSRNTYFKAMHVVHERFSVAPTQRAVAWCRISDALVERVARRIHRDARSGAIRSQQLNLAGYSYGAVFQAHVALLLVDNGYTIDCLILVVAPVPANSRLYRYLSNHRSIKRIIRHDISGDNLSNPTISGQTLLGAFQNLGDGGHHFDLARPDNPATPNVNEGTQANNRIRALSDQLHQAGVR
jgi:hypothetical protein